MKTINVELTGTSDLLMNRYSVDSYQKQKAGGRAIGKIYDPKIEAENSAYWKTTGKKELMIPSNAIYCCILNASSFMKIGKRSAKPILAGSIKIEPAEIGLGTDKYEIDSRGVVIQRSRVIKSRALVKCPWKIKFQIVYNENAIGEPLVIKNILEQAGERVGLLDYRPARSGWFGCFKVSKFE